jgi:hypothetical protein
VSTRLVAWDINRSPHGDGFYNRLREGGGGGGEPERRRNSITVKPFGDTWKFVSAFILLRPSTVFPL